MNADHGDAVAAYWRSVVEAHNGPAGAKQRRAGELLRLKGIADDFRGLYLPQLPPITISTAELGGRVSASVDPLGSWGQGVSITIKTTRVDPFNTTGADVGLPPTASKDKSLLFGLPYLHTLDGEALRSREVELLVIQQLLRAFQYLTVETPPGCTDAAVDLRSYGGNGDWWAKQANTVWRQWCDAEGVPFVPVRHSRIGREEDTPTIQEIDLEDQPFTVMRPSSAGWPAAALAMAREMPEERPAALTVRGDEYPISEEQWTRWQMEVAQQKGAAMRWAIGSRNLLNAVAWEEGRLPQIDEVDGEPVVKMPPAMAAVAMSSRVNINYDAAEALQAMEALLAGVDLERGTNLWPTFLQLANNHPKAPGASKVQMEMPTPIDPGQVDLAEAIAAQCNVAPERATAVVERIRRFLLTPIEPEQPTEPAPVVITEPEQRPDPVDPGNPNEHRLSRGFAWPFTGKSELAGRFVVGRKQGKAIAILVCRPNPHTSSEFTSKPAPWPVIYGEASAKSVADRLGCNVFRADTAEGLLSDERGPWQWVEDPAPINPEPVAPVVITEPEQTVEEAMAQQEQQRAELAANREQIRADHAEWQKQLKPEPSQSQLRKLPEWPAGRSNSQSTGQRMRLTVEQVAVLEAAIQTRIDAGMKQIKIAAELAPWCGQTDKAVQTRVRKLQRGVPSNG